MRKVALWFAASLIALGLALAAAISPRPDDPDPSAPRDYGHTIHAPQSSSRRPDVDDPAFRRAG